MKIIMLGAPGAGKGTQAIQIAEKYGIPHVSTGDLFRHNISNNTDLGKEAKSYMDAGKLVPDELTVRMLFDRVSKEDCANGYVLDGFPRTVEQADALDGILKALSIRLTRAVDISVPSDVLVERAVGRRICKKCGATYHIRFNPSKAEGVCDACGGETYQRADDSEATMKNRLSVYEAQTKPLISYYREAGLYSEIDGSQEMSKVFADITACLEK